MSRLFLSLTSRVLISLVVCCPGTLCPRAANAPARPVPVILDTDIGDDIDDTWALVMALRSPELDVKLVVRDSGNTEQRARLLAKLLELAGRTDMAIGVGLKQDGDEGSQAEWVGDYDLARYRAVHMDGVKAMIDTIMGSSEPVTLICIGPLPNLKAALEREPRIAGKRASSGCTAASTWATAASRSPNPSGT